MMGKPWSTDLIRRHRPQQQRTGLRPGGGRGGGDNDASAVPTLDEAGDLLEVVGADAGGVVVDGAGASAAAEPDSLGGSDQVSVGGAVGPQEPKPERGPVGQGFGALAGGGVEVKLKRPSRAQMGGRDSPLVAGDRVQRGRIGQHRGPVGERGAGPPSGRRYRVQREERPPGWAARLGQRDDYGGNGGHGRERHCRVPPYGGSGHRVSLHPSAGSAPPERRFVARAMACWVQRL